MSYHSGQEEARDVGNNYIPMERMELLDTREIEENRISAELYLTRALGDTLGHILEDCSQTEPDDPILFVANSLERWSLFPF